MKEINQVFVITQRIVQLTWKELTIVRKLLQLVLKVLRVLIESLVKIPRF